MKFNKISVLLKTRDRVGVWVLATEWEIYREARKVYRERVIERVGESVGYNKTGKSLQK